ncbi:hypothetical protein [Echinicola rosea]|uniref:Uncharacterized protein n=1 Tax=Echinicola rosea TaxID=1807691 RepID=A0ABQ1V6C4_9BACT|nr:hypothetical protein [Echinicola rosea]GGF37461.1 hypothetical protein GCM10011339_27510 [Echinicola rosea]
MLLVLKSILFAAMLFLGSNGSETVNDDQNAEKLADFEMTVMFEGHKVMMTSTKGCAWEELGFSGYDEVIIDQSGFRTFVNGPTSLEGSSSPFLFTLTKTKEGLALSGLKGTAWKKLSFSLSEGDTASIDEMGMVSVGEHSR